ncbi:pimeloyl-ACP methyl ester carboxylesterase [Actinoplanes octamycinicus]|uniref:Pimeloyl-ACP methyl ester carboxylesterase n=1 Tax=Actinoplanes octamycinicus TaxID=135948 RepID=A0A7W7M8G3_9ACTN|nr:epoxide hydrolase family protein [Actinoplanes octamycinicus]MBB4740839.1 pimeloyl-ACP methyl ester carboxylesterase [Actinoplanes octamycinicus]GIE55742.1 microsomal epoxide hydrolase [Actinoplanes octamycinicus]
MNEFRLHLPQSDLDDLADRLSRTRWPDELPGAGDDYGIPLARVRALADRWLKFDWRAHEDELNAYPQFVTEIGGDRVDFMHLRHPDPAALPIVLTHGWPGSTVEFLDVVDRLAEHFHVVVPAIPGFGLSGPTTRRGWSQQRVAEAWAELMASLGYRRYGAQGGDWGSGISRHLAGAAPDNVVGVHINYLPTPGSPDGLSPADQARLAKTMELAKNRHPHQLLFASGPQTPAYALNDSPTGLLAFWADKFDRWSDPATPVPDDRILADVAHHWFHRTAASSARLVKESGVNVPVTCAAPLGVAVLPADITQAIRPLVEQRYDVRHWTEFPRGGHFAALEVPDLFAEDVTTFFRTLDNR